MDTSNLILDDLPVTIKEESEQVVKETEIINDQSEISISPSFKTLLRGKNHRVVDPATV